MKIASQFLVFFYSPYYENSTALISRKKSQRFQSILFSKEISQSPIPRNWPLKEQKTNATKTYTVILRFPRRVTSNIFAISSWKLRETLTGNGKLSLHWSKTCTAVLWLVYCVSFNAVKIVNRLLLFLVETI